ncbi:MAG: hypothetical protein OEY44_02340 [Candidatus Peregrinibacteria bacterium]|nr:hypothetical protein [Candidatus Peregrinibacteria bacterium]
MSVRDTVRKAWQITQVHLKKLLWYGFIPAFFSTIVSSVYIAYQYSAFRNSALFSPGRGQGQDVFKMAKKVWNVASHYPKVTIALIVIGVLIFLGYVILPPIFRGVLISAINKIRKYEPISGSMEVGVRHFFPMFEFALLTGAFSITTLFTESSFILRWWGENVFFVTLPILLFIAMAGLIISFLFTYAEYFIVLKGKNITKSIMESTILVISNLRKTFLVFMLMVLIGVRIVLNVLLVLLIPMLVIGAASYMATIFFSTYGLAFIGIFAFAILIVSSYLLGLFNIFATAVWVLTFAQLHEKEEDKKVPEPEKTETEKTHLTSETAA